MRCSRFISLTTVSRGKRAAGLDDPTPIVSGYLYKMGRIRNKVWKRRYFSFDPANPMVLYYDRDMKKLVILAT